MVAVDKESPTNDDQKELPSVLLFSFELRTPDDDFLEEFNSAVIEEEEDEFLVNELLFEESGDTEGDGDSCLLAPGGSLEGELLLSSSISKTRSIDFCRFCA